MTTCKSCEYSQRQIEKLQREVESINKELALRQSIISSMFSCEKLEQAYKDGVKDALAKGYGTFYEEKYH